MPTVLGLDPGLRFTGWGVIEAKIIRLRHLADGVTAICHAHHRATRLAWQRKVGTG